MGEIDVWMPLYIGAYLADTGDLTTEEHGAYLLLLMALWRRGGRVAFDHDRLAQAARLPRSRWDAIWGVLERFFRVQDGQVTQYRLLRELEQANKKREAAKAKASLAANSRWQKCAKQDAPSNAPAMPQAMPQAMLEQCPSPSPSPSPEDPDPDLRSPKRKRGVVDAQFGAFYSAYPRKRARGDAEKAWGQTAGQRPALEILLEAVDRLKREGRPIDKVPYPARWLRALGWDDEVVPATGNGTAPSVLDEISKTNGAKYR